ncbi:MAG: protein kinase [Acidobacteriota bacterium]|nr:protein kinase [Acidobacteriota bacterium]
MTLAAGTKLGPYEILALIGAGGMGEVYRAKDTRLGRDVAVKVLPAKFAEDGEMRERFENEAQAIARLSHPNICSIFDVGSHEGTAYLVMELLEGESLAERLAKGALPAAQVLRIGRDICAALAAAHRKGIVHRDLKPANVFLSNAGTKLLDFGLARLRERFEAGALSQVATRGASPLTGAGTVLGTIPYMAPEQLEGRSTDARTDLFALGTVLFEMATGKRPFAGDSSTAVITAILTSEPPAVSSARALSPLALDRVVKTCLAKEPDERWQSAADLGRELAWIEAEGSRPREAVAASSGTLPARSGFRVLPWLVAAAALIAGGVALLRSRAAVKPPHRVVRFSLPPPAGRAFISSVETVTLAVSPDGSRIAFVATGAARAGPSFTAAAEAGGGRGIWVRDLAALEPRPIAGTEGASSIFWSPDGRSLGFFTADKLKRVDLGGGSPVPICDVPLGAGKAGTWGAGGDILMTNVQAAAVYRVPAAGGTPVTVVEASRDAARIIWPWFLPDGKNFLYWTKLRDQSKRVMLSEPQKEPRSLLSVSSMVQYTEPGFLVFAREGALLAQRFDLRSGRVSGEPISIAEHVDYFESSGHASFSVSLNGTLAYQSHESVSRLVVFDRAGRELGTVGSPGNLLDLSMTRDGRRVFYDRTQPGIGTWDVWSTDLERNVEARVTSTPETEIAAVELPDHKSLIYSATRGGQPQLYRFEPATGREEPLVPGPGTFQIAQDISPDGRTLLYIERTFKSPLDIWALPLEGGGKPVPLLKSPFSKESVRFSPDGRYLSFISDESGRPEAYVMPYPGPGERTRVSAEGALLVRWSRDGRELIITSADRRLISVPVRTSPDLSLGTPTALFPIAGRAGWSAFEPFPDGKRFLALVPEVIAAELPLTVIDGWRPE